MQQFLASIPDFIQVVAVVALALTIFATVGSLDSHCSAYNSTTSSSIVRTYTPAGAAQDGYIEIMCSGAR